MSIAPYLKEIGRGARGAGALSRADAADLFGRVLDRTVSDLEIGAFCIAMRIKGETPDEMAGFLDAIGPRLNRLPASERPLVVLPSYNGARKLPLLTPLLALLLARAGMPVLIHGAATESGRVSVEKVLAALVQRGESAIETREPEAAVATAIARGRVVYLPTAALCPGLDWLLGVRRTIGLRNPAHSLVKLMNPCAGRAIVVGSYTHPEYAVSMAALFERVRADALLLRGTEGEPVADARRMPRMDGFIEGRATLLQEPQRSSEVAGVALPDSNDPDGTAAWTQALLAGDAALPESIARQVEHILHLSAACSTPALVAEHGGDDEG